MQALVLTMTRVGWRFSGATAALDERGREWDLMFYSPACVSLQVAQAVRLASDRRALFLQDKDGSWDATVFWKPVMELMWFKPTADWGFHHQNVLRGLIAGPH